MRAGVVGAIVYLLLPGHPLGWLTGVPLRPLSLASAVLVGLLAFAFWPPAARGEPGRAHAMRPYIRAFGLLLGALIVVKLILAWLAPDYGLPGWYFANSRFQGAPERSSEFRAELATRRDRTIHFGGDEFPVHFLNDSQRFNFYGPEAERHRNLPFSVRWQGTLYVQREASYRFWLTASGPGSLSLDGNQVAPVEAEGRHTATVVFPVSEGWSTVQIK